jgi:hypothetical protein
MPAQDVIHNAVKTALIKDGWTITHDPLFIRIKGIQMYIDLGAERVIGAEKDGQKIAVEVKSFQGTSAISEFHIALGQYLNYQQALEEQDPTRIVYLAIPLDAYDLFFTVGFIQEVVQRHRLKLIVCDIEEEVIVKWQT